MNPATPFSGFRAGRGIPFLVLAFSLAAPMQAAGTATGESVTSHGRRQSIYAFPTGDSESVVTSNNALIDLGAQRIPLGIAKDGEVMLAPDGPGNGYEHGSATVAYRWRAGVETPLIDPDDVPHGTSQPLVNRNGWVIAKGSTWDWGEKSGEDLRISLGWTLVWLPGQTQPLKLTSPLYEAHTFDFWLRKSTASVIAINDESKLWGWYATGTKQYDPPEQKYGYVVDAFARWDEPGGGPVTPAGSFEVSDLYGVNSHGQLIGRFNDDARGGYFVDRTAVDFYPMAINGAGYVLGQRNYPNFLLWKDGREYPVPAGRLTGLDDDGNLYGFTPDGRHVMWTTDPASRVSDPAAGVYQPIEYERALLPAAWTSTHEVLPGDDTIQLGTGRYQPPDSPATPPASHAFILVPAELRVDADRDGRIDLSPRLETPDRDFAAKQRPYYFWINDDDDEGELNGADIPGQPAGVANYADGQVNGVRDLVDFFPVYLDIRRLLGILPPAAGYAYKLRHADGAVNYVRTTLTPDTAGAYLTDAAVATALAHAPVTHVLAAGVELPADFLDAIRTQNQGVILLEGRAKSTQPLVLEVWKNGSPVTAIELALSLGGVEDMFRHLNLAGADRLAMPAVADRPVAANYPDEFGNGKKFVFVHGYNVNEQQARGWEAEMFKRLFWAGSRAQFWGVTWHGSDSQTGAITPNYHLNVAHAFTAAGPLAAFVNGLGGGVSVAAHSLGNLVVSSAIRDHGAAIDSYFLVNAAVAAEAYDGSTAVDRTMPHTDWTRSQGGEYPRRLWASEWHALFPAADARSGLTWRDRLEDRRQTAYYNFYSSGEEVLAEDADYTRTVLGVVLSEAWRYLFGATNGEKLWAYQEKLKGRTATGVVIGSNYGGWGFNQAYAIEQGMHGTHGTTHTWRAPTPSEATALSAGLSDAALQAKPFFDPGSGKNIEGESLAALFTDAGSDYARRHSHLLLAQMIPATSPAAGRVAVGVFGRESENNFDMNAGFQTGWPTVRTQKGDRRWYHSDLRGVAYVYSHTLFEKWVELGGLNQ